MFADIEELEKDAHIWNSCKKTRREEKWLRPKLVISICDWEQRKTTWRRSGSENIHLDKGQRRTRRSAWKPSRRVRRSPPPTRQDSTHDDGEVRNDFLSNTESYIYRHHVESRVKLHVQREEIVRIPLRYLDVSRATNRDLDVLLKRRADDNWNIDGYRELSDARSGFTWITLLDERPPDEYTWSRRRLTKRRVTSMSDHLCPEIRTNMSDAAQQWEKQKWVIEKPKLDNVWKLRGLYFVDPEDVEFKETLKNTRKMEILMEAVVSCKIRKSQHRETCCYTDNRKSKTCMHHGSRRIHKKAFGRNPA